MKNNLSRLILTSVALLGSAGGFSSAPIKNRGVSWSAAQKSALPASPLPEDQGDDKKKSKKKLNLYDDFSETPVGDQVPDVKEGTIQDFFKAQMQKKRDNALDSLINNVDAAQALYSAVHDPLSEGTIPLDDVPIKKGVDDPALTRKLYCDNFVDHVTIGVESKANEAVKKFLKENLSYLDFDEKSIEIVDVPIKNSDKTASYLRVTTTDRRPSKVKFDILMCLSAPDAYDVTTKQSMDYLVSAVKPRMPHWQS